VIEVIEGFSAVSFDEPSEVQTSKTGSHKIFLNYRRLFPWLGIIIIPTLGL
jgi:hypothetical protein